MEDETKLVNRGSLKQSADGARNGFNGSEKPTEETMVSTDTSSCKNRLYFGDNLGVHIVKRQP